MLLSKRLILRTYSLREEESLVRIGMMLDSVALGMNLCKLRSESLSAGLDMEYNAGIHIHKSNTS